MTSEGARLWVLGCGLSMVMALGTGCAKAHAKSLPDGPPLEVPRPPPHVIAAAEEPIPSPPEERPATSPAQPARPTPAPAPRAARPEPKLGTPSESPAAAAETRPGEPRTLRAPGDAARERALRDRLSAASRDLGRVDYARLSASGRTQYDQAKRFIEQAEQGIKEQNLVFAATLADKAAALARDLLGR